MTIRNVLSSVAMVMAVAVLFFSCEDKVVTPNDPTPENGKLQILSPKGGESFKVGDQVTIKFVVDPKIVLKTDISISIDNGKNFKDITSSSVPSNGQKSLTYTWTIGKENQTVDYIGTNKECILKIKDYQSPENTHKSKAFTIIKP